MKKCSRCNEFLPESSFHKNSVKTSGIRSDCRKCRNLYRREFRKKNKSQFFAYENTEKFKQRSFKNRLKRDYGLSIEEFNKMEIAQEGKCAICKNPESHKTKFGYPWTIIIKQAKYADYFATDAM